MWLYEWLMQRGVLAARSNHHNFDFDGAQLNGIVSSLVN